MIKSIHAFVSVVQTLFCVWIPLLFHMFWSSVKRDIWRKLAAFCLALSTWCCIMQNISTQNTIRKTVKIDYDHSKYYLLNDETQQVFSFKVNNVDPHKQSTDWWSADKYELHMKFPDVPPKDNKFVFTLDDISKNTTKLPENTDIISMIPEKYEVVFDIFKEKQAQIQQLPNIIKDGKVYNFTIADSKDVTFMVTGKMYDQIEKMSLRPVKLEELHPDVTELVLKVDNRTPDQIKDITPHLFKVNVTVTDLVATTEKNLALRPMVLGLHKNLTLQNSELPFVTLKVVGNEEAMQYFDEKRVRIILPLDDAQTVGNATARLMAGGIPSGVTYSLEPAEMTVELIEKAIEPSATAGEASASQVTAETDKSREDEGKASQAAPVDKLQ